MKKLVFLLVLLLAGCALHKPQPVPPPPSIPHTATELVMHSIARFTIDVPGVGNGVCTAWSEAPRRFVTAAHCTAPEDMFSTAILRVNGTPAFTIKQDVDRDLSLLVADLVLPALHIRQIPLTADPVLGYEAVKAIGYGYGWNSPIVTTHTAMLLHYTLAPGLWPGTVFIDGFVMGMSGGPVYDWNGDVVGVVQRGTDKIGYGVDSATLREFLEG